MRSLTLLLACILLQDPPSDPEALVGQVLGEDTTLHAPAADALVKRAKEARAAVLKGLAKAKDEPRRRIEEVLLRIDAGTDAASGKAGALSVELELTSMTLAARPEGKGRQWNFKTRIIPFSDSDREERLEIRRGWLVMVGERFELATAGADKKPISKAVPPRSGAGFEFGVAISTNATWKPGMRATVVLELGCGKETVAIRSPFFDFAEKP